MDDAIAQHDILDVVVLAAVPRKGHAPLKIEASIEARGSKPALRGCVPIAPFGRPNYMLFGGCRLACWGHSHPHEAHRLFLTVSPFCFCFQSRGPDPQPQPAGGGRAPTDREIKNARRPRATSVSTGRPRPRPAPSSGRDAER